jgi:two-component system CheB/CheR fusion protein
LRFAFEPRAASDAAAYGCKDCLADTTRAHFFGLQRQIHNMQATIRSIVRRTADTTGTVEEYAAHLEARLDAIARVEGFLLRAPHGRVDLEELVRTEFLAQSIQDEQLQILGPRVLLDPKAAGSLGLALHELTTNSIKFGALGHRAERVHVRWRLEPPERSRVVFDWREHVGRVLSGVNRRGFGFELIEQLLPHELGGASSIVVHPDGLQCSFSFENTGVQSSCRMRSWKASR